MFLKTGRKGNTYNNHTTASDRRASYKNRLIYSGTITWLKHSQPLIYVHIYTPHICTHSTRSDIILMHVTCTAYIYSIQNTQYSSFHPQHTLHTHPNTLRAYIHTTQRCRHTQAHSYHTHRNAFLSRTVTPARTSHTSIECVLAHNLLTGISHNLEQKDRVKERDSCEHGGKPPNPLLKFSHTH